MKVSLLATGDELTNGDILNTNGQTIALKLVELGFVVGSHLIVSDIEMDIIDGIHYLLDKHDIVIITGGLGPTSDDKTRFALAKALHQDLLFHEPSWEKIVTRIKQFKFEIHESNKQQALFPAGAEVIPNPYGTAPGCMIHVENKIIFMLPGPPRECLPMFYDNVIPQLQTIPLDKPYHFFKWRLFGVNESEVAATLDALVKPDNCLTGYRWDYPYLEFKLHIPRQANAENIINLINDSISTFIICDPSMTASETLRHVLKTYPGVITIFDNATGGRLEAKLMHPQTRSKLLFVREQHKLPQNQINVEIEGLDELWNSIEDKHITTIKLKINNSAETLTLEKQIPFRDHRVLDYAVEYIAYEIKKYLETNA